MKSESLEVRIGERRIGDHLSSTSAIRIACVPANRHDGRMAPRNASSARLRKFTLAFATGLVLTGCAAPVAPTVLEAKPEPPAQPSGPVLNLRNNIALMVGEPVSITFPGAGNEAIRMVVTAVERDPECPGDPLWYLPPENGQFVSLMVEITTSDDYLELMAGQEPLTLFWNDWFGIDSGGRPIENSPNGFGCHDLDVQLPQAIPSGATSTGPYVLDLPPGTTTIAWKPTYIFGVDYGFEWDISKI